jgi:hypothetical protein
VFRMFQIWCFSAMSQNGGEDRDKLNRLSSIPLVHNDVMDDRVLAEDHGSVDDAVGATSASTLYTTLFVYFC